MTDAAVGGPAATRGWVVETHGLSKIFGDGVQVRALDDVSLQIGRGELVAVMGPSGSGKSTLLHMLGALDRPTEGRVCINGRDLAEVADIDRFRAREIGFIFQLHNLIPTLTARENVEVPMQGVGVPGTTRRARATGLLSALDLEDRADFLPGQLSGGERQRVAIARALANDPALILADEPTGNLDSTAGAQIVSLLLRLSREEHRTVLLVTHDPVVALSAERILTLRDGRIDQDERVDRTYLRELERIRHTALGRLLFGEQPVGRTDTGQPGAAATSPPDTRTPAR
jgi:ABC-type lipoprotein export system ATPase subunit